MPGRTSHACWRDPTQEAFWHLLWDINNPLKRHTDICRGIAVSYAYPLVVSNQEAHWYLSWDYYLYRTPTRGAHSRGILTFAVGLLFHMHTRSSSHSGGILTFAVGLLSYTHTHSWCPLKRHTDIWRGIAVSYAHQLLFSLNRHTDNCRDLLYLYNPLVAPHKKHAIRCVEPPFFISVRHCYNSGHKPTSAQSRDNTVYCRGVVGLSLFLLVWNIYY